MRQRLHEESVPVLTTATEVWDMYGNKMAPSNQAKGEILAQDLQRDSKMLGEFTAVANLQSIVVEKLDG